MRLFVGVDLPIVLKQTLLEFQSELRQLGVYASWKSQENFHLTLEFLGELNFTSIPTLSKVLSKVARNNKTFKLSLGGLGAFPSIQASKHLVDSSKWKFDRTKYTTK
jgi:2'-5' RNA ligase